MLSFSENELIALRKHEIFDASLLNRFNGGNSTVLHITSSGIEKAFKIYSNDRTRNIRSLNHELEAFKVLERIQNIQTAKFLSKSEIEPSICYEWIKGKHPENTIQSRSILIDCIYQLRVNFNRVGDTLDAVDSINSSHNLLKQIEFRHSELNDISGVPVEMRNQFENLYKELKMELTQTIPLPFDTLSFSDYGLHNLLVDETGNFTFIDFEFFGKDSQIKVICDLYAHPKGVLSSKDLESLFNLLSLSNDESDLILRCLPAIALKWSYIIFRRCIDWENRRFEGLGSNFENPLLMLEYVNYLLKIDSNTSLKTFIEFKSMR